MPELHVKKKVEQQRSNMLIFTLVELIEHIPKEKHTTLIENITRLEPDVIILTTPNREFNKFFNMTEGQMRDTDHKFEFDPSEFEQFVEKMSSSHYDCVIKGLKYPNPSRIVGQFKHKLEEFNEIPATFMAILTLKKRNHPKYEAGGFVELPFIDKPMCIHKFKDLISTEEPKPKFVPVPNKVKE